MINIYVGQVGLNSIGGGITLGAILFHGDGYSEFYESLSYSRQSKKMEELVIKLEGKYEALYDQVDYFEDISDLDIYRKIRIQCENLVYNLVSMLGLPLKACQIYLDGNLPKINIGNVIRVKPSKKYPLIHTAIGIIEGERLRAMNKLQVLYPKHRFTDHRGRITPSHLDVLFIHGKTPVHRHNAPDLIAEYIYRMHLKKTKDLWWYTKFFTAKTPDWINFYYKHKYNISIKKLKDLFTEDQKIRYINPISQSIEVLNKNNNNRLIKSYKPRITKKEKEAVADMRNWLTAYAPEDLKDDILL